MLALPLLPAHSAMQKCPPRRSR
ncbi:hypothetical protein pipiens_020561, partial [Culex pipiens pipiens]